MPLFVLGCAETISVRLRSLRRRCHLESFFFADGEHRSVAVVDDDDPAAQESVSGRSASAEGLQGHGQRAGDPEERPPGQGERHTEVRQGASASQLTVE